MAIDPGFRTGCKVVLLDRQGKLLHNDVIYPDQGAAKTAEAKEKLAGFVKFFQIEAIAIGNGTGGSRNRDLRPRARPARRRSRS